jgi:hypothetical protein
MQDGLYKAALHVLKFAHDAVHCHSFSRTNEHSFRNTNPTGAKMKTYLEEST